MKKFLLIVALVVLGASVVIAQTSTGSTATPGSDNNASATGSTTPPDQNQTSTGATSTDNNAQTGTSGAAATTDQSGTVTSATGASDQSATASTGRHPAKGGNLPQTASPLPFLGLIGFGSVAAGMVTRRLRK